MPAHYKARPERWPQVSLKGFFVLVTLLGVLLGWLGVQVKWIRDRHDAIDESIMFSSGEKVVPAPWSLRIFGEAGIEAFIIDLNQPKETQKRERERLAPLFPEAELIEEYMPHGIPVVG